MENNSKRLYKYIARQKKLISLGVLATLLVSLVELFTGSMLKFLIDLIDRFSGSFAEGVLQNAKLPVKYLIKLALTNDKITVINKTLKGADEILEGMLLLCLVFVGLYFLQSLFNYLRRVFMNAATQRILKEFKSDIYSKILKLPFGFFRQNKTGDVVSRITYDVTTLNEIIDLLIEVARASIYILVFIPVMFMMSWELSLFTILYFPLSVVLIHVITKSIKKVSKSITDNVGDYTAFLEEKINKIQLVKGFGKERKEEKAFDDLVDENYHHNIRLIKLKYFLNPGSDFLGMIVLSVIYIFYSYKLVHGHGSLGDIVFFLYLVRTAYKPVKKVAQAWGQLHVALVSTKKIFHLMDEKEEDNTWKDEDVKPAKSSVDSISFEGLSFSYPDDNRVVFKDLNFEASNGDIVGVSGKTGSGKTTLLNLIPAFYLPDSGRIRINNIEGIALSQLREMIVYLGTDSLMVDGTIRENIEYSGREISKNKSPEFVKFIGLDNENELDWVIGKDGVNLSDGQKQKVAFLRAIITEPEILIMDEVFSSLDMEDIQFIMQQCEAVVSVVFIVSRKDQVLKFANKFIKL